MKRISVHLDDAALETLQKIAETRHTTVEALLEELARQMAEQYRSGGIAPDIALLVEEIIRQERRLLERLSQ